MTVGAPDAEAKFKGAVKIAMEEDSNARHYPVIYVCSQSCFVFVVDQPLIGIPWLAAQELAFSKDLFAAGFWSLIHSSRSFVMDSGTKPSRMDERTGTVIISCSFN
jgi:hypothetical protein